MAVATAIRVELRDGVVKAEGDLDFRGTLGVSKETPVGFTDIRLSFELDTDAEKEQLDTLVRLTERYCVVYQTLASPLQFEWGMRLPSRCRRQAGTGWLPMAFNATRIAYVDLIHYTDQSYLRLRTSKAYFAE